MNDPMDRLRADHAAGAGSPDDDAALTTIRDRIGHAAAGSATRRRRIAWTGGGLAGAGCAGIAVALVLSGTPADPPRPAVEDRVVADPTAGPDSGVAPARPAAWYADRAAEAIDLSDAILQVDTATGVRHPGDPELDFATTREYISADGTASRWVNVRNWAADVYPTPIGTEDDKYVSADGTLTYVYVDPEAGIYASFHPEIPAELTDEVGTIDAQARDALGSIRGLSESIRELDADPQVVAASPETVEIDGAPATCFAYSWSGSDVDPGDVETTAWTSRFCFDDATQPPLSDEYERHYALPDREGESVWRTETTFVWHENTPENQSLLQPATEGLREVDIDEYYRLTTP